MKSIRLSLMVYFLALLGVALLTASLLVYHIAEKTLTSKQEAMEQFIQAQYRERCQEEKDRLEAALLAQARTLARLVQVQFERYRVETIQSLLLLGALSNNLSPNGHLLASGWLSEGWGGGLSWPDQPNPFYNYVHRVLRDTLKPGIRLKLDALGVADNQVSDFSQIDSPTGESLHSDSMEGRSFTLDPSVFEQDGVADWHFDDTRLGDTRVHRVVFKASGVAWRFPPSQPLREQRGQREPSASSTRPRGAPPPPPTTHRGPTIFVHCASSTDKLAAAIAGFRQEQDDELARVANETRDSLGDLLNWLWGISLAVFAATAVGSFWLVRLGLSPLRRLSYAVSRVSVKDFRLPLDERPLPLELRPIVQRLNSTLDLLKRAFSREKQAAADISHELRTPLAALMTTTELGLRKPRTPEHYRELLGDVHASALQMNQIVERLLTLARLDAGVDRMRVQSVDVCALTKQCADVIRPLAEARGLKLTVKNRIAPPNGSNGDSPCLMHTDPDKLREILTNLLHNAIQYNRPDGVIDLSVARENGTLQVEVHDTGIGIAEEARERIFERFYRVDPSRGGDDLHAGLGLAIVKEYIDLMDGSIGVESTEGQGSTFRILLPVR